MLSELSRQQFPKVYDCDMVSHLDDEDFSE